MLGTASTGDCMSFIARISSVENSVSSSERKSLVDRFLVA